MSSNWPIVRIDDIKADRKNAITIGPFGSRMKSECYTESGIAVIRGTNLGPTSHFINDFVYITEEKADELASCNVYKNDLVFPHRGSIGEVGIVEHEQRYVLSSSLMKLTCATDKACPKFVYYFFKSSTGRHELLKNASQVGTPGIGQPLSSLKSIELSLPPLRTQENIAKILSSLDEKIHINQKINQTLEQMAQALFKSWFVDFEPVKAKIAVLEAGGSQVDATLAAMSSISGKDVASLAVFECEQPEKYAELRATAELFPFAMRESKLGHIPDGWEMTTLAEKIKIIGGGTPKRSESDYWGGDICWYSVKDAPRDGDVFVIDTVEKITAKGLNNSSTKLLPVGTTIISARGTVGKLALVAVEMAMNQSCYGISGQDFSGPFLTYLRVKKCIDVLKRNTHGAVFDTITTNTFETVDILTAHKKINDKFEEIITPLFNTIKNNLVSNAYLSQLRDMLLPKLISGEIDLSVQAQILNIITEEA